MGRARTPDRGATSNDGALTHNDRIEIRERDLHAWNWLDRDGPHPCDAAGERDPSRDGRTHDIADNRGVVDAPVAGVTAHGSVVRCHMTIYRWHQAHSGKSKGCEHVPPPSRSVCQRGFTIQRADR